MSKYGPKPIYEIDRYRRMGRVSVLLLILIGCGLAFTARHGTIELWLWLIPVCSLGIGGALGVRQARVIVRRADEVFVPGAGASLAPLAGSLIAIVGLGVLRATADEPHQVFIALGAFSGCLAYLAATGLIVDARLRAIVSGEREWPWPSHLDE